MSDRSLTKTRQKNDKHKQTVSLAFGSMAAFYDSWYHSHIGSYVWKVETEAVRAFLDQQIPGVALEIGVGTGMALPILQSVSSQLVGIDIAWQMLAVARRKFMKIENVHLVLSDGTKLPFRKKCTDLALGMTVLEFIRNREEFLLEIHRCLRPAGQLLLGVLTSTNLWAIERRVRSIAQHDIFKLAKFPNPWQVTRMLHENGFCLIDYRGAVYAPSFAPRACLHVFSQLDAKWGTRWLGRALGAFLVFHARRIDPK